MHNAHPKKTSAPKWVSTPERGSLLLMRLVVWWSLRLGRALTRPLLHPICLYFVLFSPSARKASRAYLQRALHTERVTHLQVYTHFLHFATVLLDRFYFLHNDLHHFNIQMEGAEDLTSYNDGSTLGGVFLFGAHMGSFDAVRAVGAIHIRNPLVLLLYPENSKKILSALKRIDANLDQNIIELGGMESMLKVRDAIDGGAMVGVLADRALSPKESLALSFLGENAPFSSAPFRMAAMLRKPVFFMAGLYLGDNKYKIVFKPIYDFSSPDPEHIDLSNAEKIAIAMRKYVHTVEQCCYDHPYNWFNFYDFWKP